MFEAANDFEIQLQFIASQKAKRQKTNGAIKHRRNRNSISFDSWCSRSETSESEELIDSSDTRITLNQSKGNDVNSMEKSEAAKEQQKFL